MTSLLRGMPIKKKIMSNVIIKFSLCVIHVFTIKTKLFTYKRSKGERYAYKNTGSSYLKRSANSNILFLSAGIEDLFIEKRQSSSNI